MKKIFFALLIFTFVLAFAGPALSEEKADSAVPSTNSEEQAGAINPDEHAHGFFETMIKGQWRDAPGEFLKGSRIIRQDPLAPDKIVQQLTSFGKDYGIPNGYELLKRKPIGDSMIYFVYVLKFPVKPVIWELQYYKFSDNWELININLPPGLNFIRDFEK